MRHSGDTKGEEADIAAWEAARGALTGAARWGLYSAVVGAAGFAFSPIYRGLTFQFKVYIQMSGMIMGGMIGADNRLREYEARVRVHKRMAIDRATWERYEQAYEEPKKNGAKATKKTKENNNE